MRVVEPVVEMARGLWTTLNYLFEKKVTTQYPKKRNRSSRASAVGTP